MTAPYVDFHTHRDYSEQNVVYLHSYSIGRDVIGVSSENKGITAGLHPWGADLNSLQNIIETLSHIEIKAIGEIGLDYSTQIDHKVQKKVFEEQLKVAEQRQLPVVIHCVRAFEDVITIVGRYRLKNVALHGFIGSPEQAKRAVAAGYYVSFAPSAFGSPKTIEAMKSIGLNYLFVESDAEDIDIAELYIRYANLLNISSLQLQEITYKNYTKFLG